MELSTPITIAIISCSMVLLLAVTALLAFLYRHMALTVWDLQKRNHELQKRIWASEKAKDPAAAQAASFLHASTPEDSSDPPATRPRTQTANSRYAQ